MTSMLTEEQVQRLNQVDEGSKGKPQPPPSDDDSLASSLEIPPGLETRWDHLFPPKEQMPDYFLNSPSYLHQTWCLEDCLHSAKIEADKDPTGQSSSATGTGPAFKDVIEQEDQFIASGERWKVIAALDTRKLRLGTSKRWTHARFAPPGCEPKPIAHDYYANIRGIGSRFKSLTKEESQRWVDTNELPPHFPPTGIYSPYGERLTIGPPPSEREMAERRRYAEIMSQATDSDYESSDTEIDKWDAIPLNNDDHYRELKKQRLAEKWERRALRGENATKAAAASSPHTIPETPDENAFASSPIPETPDEADAEMAPPAALDAVHDQDPFAMSEDHYNAVLAAQQGAPSSQHSVPETAAAEEDEEEEGCGAPASPTMAVADDDAPAPKSDAQDVDTPAAVERPTPLSPSRRAQVNDSAPQNATPRARTPDLTEKRTHTPSSSPRKKARWTPKKTASHLTGSTSLPVIPTGGSPVSPRSGARSPRSLRSPRSNQSYPNFMALMASTAVSGSPSAPAQPEGSMQANGAAVNSPPGGGPPQLGSSIHAAKPVSPEPLAQSEGQKEAEGEDLFEFIEVPQEDDSFEMVEAPPSRLAVPKRASSPGTSVDLEESIRNATASDFNTPALPASFDAGEEEVEVEKLPGSGGDRVPLTGDANDDAVVPPEHEDESASVLAKAPALENECGGEAAALPAPTESAPAPTAALPSFVRTSGTPDTGSHAVAPVVPAHDSAEIDELDTQQECHSSHPENQPIWLVNSRKNKKAKNLQNATQAKRSAIMAEVKRQNTAEGSGEQKSGQEVAADVGEGPKAAAHDGCNEGEHAEGSGARERIATEPGTPDSLLDGDTDEELGPSPSALAADATM